tara:strand:- start:5337 stop:6407 length:1071 start_codon:yes stop_codon:yes gene_type:complete
MSDVAIDIKNFVKVAAAMPASITIQMVGAHGIGKSALVYQIAEEIGLKVVERRISQMSDGDLIGLPDLSNGTTTFASPDWFVDCCENARCLFLDEINRGTPEVMQASFQLVNARELNGRKLHPETRVFAAVNPDGEYSVTMGDAAFRDRFASYLLEPTLEDWLDWAKGPGEIHPILVDFIRQNPRHLEHEGSQEPDKVYPSRRSWEKVNTALSANDLMDEPSSPLFYHLTRGLAGNEASIAFVEHAKNFEMVLSAEDILDRFDEVKDRVEKATADQLNGFIEKVVDHSGDNTWTGSQVKNAGKFGKALGGELLIAFWNKLSDGKAGNFKNVQLVHKELKLLLLDAVNGSQDKVDGS